MTKLGIKDIQSRIQRLEKTDSPEWMTRVEGEARMAWIIRHLTQDEQMELCRAVKAYKDDSATPSEAANAVFRKGEDRAGTEPPSAYEEFKEKYVRAEALRHAGRHLTDAEGNELRDLNAWFWER